MLEFMVAFAIMGVLSAIALGAYSRHMEKVQTMQLTVDISAIASLVTTYAADHAGFPDSLADINQAGKLDPYGNPYQYISHDNPKGKGKWRKDHNIVPINSDFDLWSNGKDGKSSPPLTAKASRDDFIRASDGRFIGLAAEFDP